MTINEAAELLGVHRSRVWQYCRDGLLPYRRIGPVYVIPGENVRALKANPPRRGRPPKAHDAARETGAADAE